MTKGQYAIVDPDDYERLSKWKWCVDSRGYAVRSEKRSETGRKFRKIIRMHREIINAPDDLFVDHKNHKTLDNRKTNLRVCTPSQSRQNVRALINKSGFKGVWWDNKRKRWVAYIKQRGITLSLGRFADKNDAARAYNQKAQELFGEFAYLNKVGNENRDTS